MFHVLSDSDLKNRAKLIKAISDMKRVGLDAIQIKVALSSLDIDTTRMSDVFTSSYEMWKALEGTLERHEFDILIDNRTWMS